jgi:hypothetical protein
MVQILLYIIPVFITYKFVRFYWLSNRTLKTRNKLERLNNELRWLAINNIIDKNDTRFIHLDETMNNTILLLPRFNFWAILYLMAKEKHVFVFPSNKKGNENPHLERITDLYHKILIKYIFLKSFFSIIITMPIWKRLINTIVRKSSSSNNSNLPPSSNKKSSDQKRKPTISDEKVFKRQSFFEPEDCYSFIKDLQERIGRFKISF